MRWIAKLRNTLLPRRLDADLADELRDHIERRTADLIHQGLTPFEARRQAQLWLGNTTALQEQSREIRMWSEFEKTWQDIRYGVRGLLRNPALALTGTLSLSLAIAANSAVFSLIDAAFLRPLTVPDPHSLVTLGTASDLFSYPAYEALRSTAGDSARIALFTTPNRAEALIDGPDSPNEKATLQFVSPNTFDMLGLPPRLGSLFNPQLDHYPSPRNVIALSYGYWTRRFGADPAVIGRSLTLDGRTYTVIGVVHQGFAGVDAARAVDVFLPISLFDPGIFTNRDARLFRLMGRLAPGVTARQLAARLQPVQTLAVESGAQGISTFGHQYGRALLILSVLSACILLIACANLAGLLLARAASRSDDIALRVSLGARRGRLIRQFVTESALIVLGAASLGWVLAAAAGRALLSIVSTPANPIALDMTPDLRGLAFSAAVCAIAVLIVGLAPAFQVTSTGTAAALRQSGASGKRLRLGRVFVSIQVAFAFSLVTLGSGFLYSLRHLTTVNTGFSPGDVTVLTMTSNSQDHALQLELMRQTEARIAALPQVQSAAAAWMPVLSGARRAQRVVLADHQAPGEEVTFYRVSPRYFATLRTPLLAGRDLNGRDNDDEPVPTVVNRAFARRYFHTDSVIGKEFRRDDGALHQIVGLAADSHFVDLRLGPEPIAYMPMKPTRSFTLYVRSRLDTLSLVKLIDRQEKETGSGMRVKEFTTLDAIIGSTLIRERLLASAGAAFALLGLTLSAIGIFGLLNYSVTMRTSEIGIRGALGAGTWTIRALILKDTAVLTGGGLVAGLTASLLLMRLARSLLFEVRIADPSVIASSLVCFLAVAMVAAGLPALRAAAIDPIQALRHN